jgi:hypothetical protein
LGCQATGPQRSPANQRRAGVMHRPSTPKTAGDPGVIRGVRGRKPAGNC